MKQIKVLVSVCMVLLSIVMLANAAPGANFNVSSTPGKETAVPTNTEVPAKETAIPTNTGVPAKETAVPTEVPVGVELVKNGGFELKDGSNNSVLTPWTLENGTKDKVKCNQPGKTVAYRGTCAFFFKGQTGENSQLVQTIDLSGARIDGIDTLTLSAFIKATNEAAAGKLKLLVTYNDNTPKGKLSMDLVTAADYTRLSNSLNMLPGVAGIKIVIEHSSTAGKVYVDDVSLNCVDATPGKVIPLP